MIKLGNGSSTKGGAPAETPGSLDDLITAAGLIADETGETTATPAETVGPEAGDAGTDCCLIRFADRSVTAVGDVWGLFPADADVNICSNMLCGIGCISGSTAGLVAGSLLPVRFFLAN